MDTRELKRMIKLMRSEGVLTVKTSELELTLSPTALFPKKESEDTSTDIKQETTYSEEDALFWSSGGVGDN